MFVAVILMVIEMGIVIVITSTTDVDPESKLRAGNSGRPKRPENDNRDDSQRFEHLNVPRSVPYCRRDLDAFPIVNRFPARQAGPASSSASRCALQLAKTQPPTFDGPINQSMRLNPTRGRTRAHEAGYSDDAGSMVRPTLNLLVAKTHAGEKSAGATAPCQGPAPNVVRVAAAVETRRQMTVNEEGRGVVFKPSHRLGWPVQARIKRGHRSTAIMRTAAVFLTGDAHERCHANNVTN